MADLILVDGNSVGYAAHQGTILKSGDQETQAIYGVLEKVRGLYSRNPHDKVLILWDGRSWRKDIFEPYKANRDDSPEKVKDRERYKSQRPFITKALETLGVPQLNADNYEADDLAAKMVKGARKSGQFVRMITADRDWLQLVNEKCVWVDHRNRDDVISLKGFSAKTGYETVEQFVQAKALQGDVSDNIQGVGGIGAAYAKYIIEIWGSVETFLADTDAASTFKYATGKNLIKPLKEFASDLDRQKRFDQNMRLMSLLGDLPEPKQLKLNKGNFDPPKFKTICHQLGFSSIYKDGNFEYWTMPFKEKIIL